MGYKRFSLLLLLCSTLLAGCASFRNNEIAEAGQLPDVSQYANKPSVFVEAHFYQGEPEAPLTEVLAMKPRIDGIVGKTFNDAGVFSKLSFDEADKASADYTVRIEVYNHGNHGAAAISGAITGATFGVIPGAATDNYTLKAKLTDRSGAVVSSSTSKDSITTWFGLWLIPAMAATPDKAVQSTLDNQLRTLLKELIEGGKLKYSDIHPPRRAGLV